MLAVYTSERIAAAFRACELPGQFYLRARNCAEATRAAWRSLGTPTTVPCCCALYYRYGMMHTSDEARAEIDDPITVVGEPAIRVAVKIVRAADVG